MTKRAADLQVGEVIEGLGVVTRIAVHSKDYRAPVRSRVGMGKRGRIICSPFKPVPVVEVIVDGSETPAFFWPKQKVSVAA